MPIDRKDYKRVPGRGADGVFPFLRWKSQLYWGHNHLLLRNTNISIDRYNRLFYDKIQSVTIQDSTKRRTKNLIWGSCIGFCVSMFVIGLLSGSQFRFFGLLIFIIAFLLLSVVNLSLNNISGPTCRLFIQTSIQQTEIHCLCRKKHAEAFFNLLVKKTNNIQGELQEENARTLFARERDHFNPTNR